MSRHYFGVTFPNGGKELFEASKVYTYQTQEQARQNSMNFSFCRTESSDAERWQFFYRGQKIKIVPINADVAHYFAVEFPPI